MTSDLEQKAQSHRQRHKEVPYRYSHVLKDDQSLIRTSDHDMTAQRCGQDGDDEQRACGGMVWY